MPGSFVRRPNGKTLLFVGGPSDAVPAMGKAWARGYRVFVVDGDIQCPGIDWVDSMFRKGHRESCSWAVGNAYDEGAVLRTCCSSRINGVLAVATDVAPVVSRVAEALGLPHVSHEISRLSWDKRALKEKLAAGGVPVPGSADFVVKPNYQGRGARGVEVVSASSDARMLPDREKDGILFERFVPGPQVSAEAIVYWGKVVFAGYTDRDYSNGFPVEAGGWGPSRYGLVYRTSLNDVVGMVVCALGLENGTVKLDLVLDSENYHVPTVIEAAVGRLSGGYMCSHYLPLAYGVDFLGAAFAVACGDDPRPFLVRNGRLRWLRGTYRDAARASTHRERGKFFLAVGRSRAEVEIRAAMVQER